MVDAITDQNFEEETKDGVVLIDFWATWCVPCKMQSPVIDQLAEERQNVKITIKKLLRILVLWLFQL